MRREGKRAESRIPKLVLPFAFGFYAERSFLNHDIRTTIYELLAALVPSRLTTYGLHSDLLNTYFNPNRVGRYVESDGKSIVMISATNIMAMNGAIEREILSREIFAIFAIT